MGLGKFFHKVSHGANKLFGKLGGVVKKVADFAAPVVKKIGEYARPVADAVSGVALAFGQPEIAALAQGAGRAVEKGVGKYEKWVSGAQEAVEGFGNKVSSKITGYGEKVRADAQNKKTLAEFLE